MNRGYIRVGHIIPNRPDLHICGYVGDLFVLVQTKVPELPRKLKLYSNNRGHYFEIKQRRIYLPHDWRSTNETAKDIKTCN